MKILASQASWEGFHAMWPATMVLQLFPKLPAEFVAEPRVHLGTNFEIDVFAFERDEEGASTASGNGGTAGSPPRPWLHPRRRGCPRSS